MFKFWRKKKSGEFNPSIFIELRPNNDIQVECEWPEPENEEFPHRYATLLNLLCTGKLLGTIQHAIAMAGEYYNDREIAQTILIHLSNSLLIGGKIDDGQLVINPREAFTGRHVNKGE